MAEEVLRISQGNPHLKLIRHIANQGKGQALMTGFQASTAPVLLLLDADLINLTVQHLEALVQPVLSREADIAMGLFQRGNIWTDISHRFMPWLSGQRCLRAGLMHELPVRAIQGYGFETCLTIMARRKKWRVTRVPWIGVTHPLGIMPRGGWSGLRRKAKMYRDILGAWLAIELHWAWPQVYRYKIRRHH
jgi:glycosyltransferase involved in cell wall biosynthesis